MGVSDIIDGIEKKIEEVRRQRSNPAKRERELRTVAAFLRTVGIGFSVHELESSDEEPPDVIFRDGRFEVIEVLDDRRRIGEELRDVKAKVTEARNLADLEPLLSECYEGEWLEQSVINSVVTKSLENKARRYSADVKASLDILVYLNVKSKSVDTYGRFSCCRAIGNQGWRSVSFVGGSAITSCVMFTRKDAPSFLRDREKQFIKKIDLNNPTEVWMIERDPVIANMENVSTLPSYYVTESEKEWQDAFQLPDKLHIDFFKDLFCVFSLVEAQKIAASIPRSELLTLREMHIQCLCSGLTESIKQVREAAFADGLSCAEILKARECVSSSVGGND